MAERFNRAMELMGWRVPVENDDYEDVDAFVEDGAKEFTLQSFPGGDVGGPRTERRPEFHSVSSSPAGSLRRISTIHPESYADARQIGEAFRSGIPVIMNLSDLPDSEARRVVDFAAGLVFGLQGSIERVTSRVFLLSPRTVEVTSSGSSMSSAMFG
ncbi:MAG: cell division protein SepF [Scrofimicrobium sp.]